MTLVLRAPYAPVLASAAKAIKRAARQSSGAPTPADNAPEAQKALPMDQNPHDIDHQPQTVTREGGDTLGWFAYSPMRQQWRSLTPDGALAYHATADDAERYLSALLPPRNRPSSRP